MCNVCVFVSVFEEGGEGGGGIFSAITIECSDFAVQ